MKGIYKITNTKNNKVYIGSSSNLKRRSQTHLTKLRCDRHTSPHLQAAFNKYGQSSFKFQIIEEVNSDEELIPREQYWCDFYKSNQREFGYNIRLVVETNRGVVISDELRKKLSDIKKGKTPSNLNLIREKQRRAVDLFLNGVLIDKFSSQEAVGKYLGIDHTAVNNVLREATKKIRGFEQYSFSYSDGLGVRKIKKKSDL